MTEDNFGRSAPWSVGAEEELMILDAGTLELAPRVDTLVAGAAERGLEGRLKTELFASVVETTTEICATAEQAAEELRGLRAAAVDIAAAENLRIAAAGSHPLSVPEEQAIAPDERYAGFVAYAGVSARRQGVSGLHVHVGVPDRETCIRALEGVLPWLPVVLAVSANSPYLAGAETGHLSARAEVLALLPRRGAPPPFRRWEDWERHVGLFVEVGLAKDYTQFWWDARAHPRFGTLEIRMPDQPTSHRRSAFFVALLQALVATVARRPARAPVDRGVYDQNRWAALHDGPRAKLIHPDEPRLATVPELAAELLAAVEPAASELGSWHLLETFDGSVCEAERQLEVGRADGLAVLCADLVDRSRV